MMRPASFLLLRVSSLSTLSYAFARVAVFGKEKTMKKLLYLFDGNKDIEQIGEEVASMAAAFDDLEADRSLAAPVIADVSWCADGALRSPDVSTLAGKGFDVGAVLDCSIDDLHSGCLREGVDSECGPFIMVEAGDLGSVSGAEVDGLVDDIVAAIPARALGRTMIVWRGGDTLDQELFVMGRIAAVRIAFAKTMGEKAEGPLLYLDTMGDAKRAASLTVEGMFDGACCREDDWSPVKFASLAQRIAE